MDFPCFHCNTETKLDVKIDVSFFACPSCGTLYSKNYNNDFKFKERFKKEIYNNVFSIGQKADFKNEIYTIIGILIKRFDSVTRWAEYVLQNDKGEFLYLSESSGNFILLEQIEFEKKVGNHPLTVDYLDKTFDRYDYTYPKLDYASGYFDYNVLNKIELIEYINPPYILSFEKFGQEQTTFYGEHISRNDVKRAFKTSAIPSKSEIGMVQPFYINVKNLAIIFCSVAILILLSHWFLNKDRSSQEVLNTSIPFENFTAKDFVSPSFELKGSSAPLQISLYSNVDNSWANVQVALINEKTNEEVYASKDIEYYHGYTDGESWKEGSTSEDFNICGVAPGKYHLTITPLKAQEDLSNSTIDITATWNKPSLRNFFMTLLFMAVFLAVVYFMSRNFEEKRWNQ
ncbi:DUF4178 domain-containing protein [Flavobacterium sp.]|uniref:DUF4178 domain-containing protein n=1 Tax=Flavobacterium sp. TaxID=239 RepID=UPI00260219F2|nr:DUF4178 domain-containing protein [Flavobacterium sp.]